MFELHGAKFPHLPAMGAIARCKGFQNFLRNKIGRYKSYTVEAISQTTPSKT